MQIMSLSSGVKMVLCPPMCCCEYCYLFRIYQHPRFRNDIKTMIEIYKLMVDPHYFPIDVVDQQSKSKL